MRYRIINWGIFIALCVIWGSSFILMKEGMTVLSPYQVASIRILSAGLVLLPFARKALKQVPKEKLALVILSGLLGNFFPAYLFCIAETQIDSSLTGILNSLTPLFTILVGIGFFQLKAGAIKIAGVMIGFIGLCLLMAAGDHVSFKNIAYAGLVLLATVCYATNVNMVGRHMQQVGALHIAALGFLLLLIPAAVILYFTGYFPLDHSTKEMRRAFSASLILGVLGTAVASIIFYMLVKRAGALFASMVTYGIPFIAILWGLWYGESINLFQIGSLAIILAGVYLVNKK